LLNAISGRPYYAEVCLRKDQIPELIAEMTGGRNLTIDFLGDGEDDSDLDAKVDALREIGQSNSYHVASIWKETFSGRNGKRVHVEIYGGDKPSTKRAVSIDYNIPVKTPRNAEARSAWFSA